MVRPEVEPAVVLSQGQIAERVGQLGAEIARDYDGREPVMVGILKGMFIFMADLVRAIPIPLVVDFMAISRYGPTAKTKGVVRIVKDLDLSITGRHVLFVEDIIDTGHTLDYLLEMLRTRGPKSLRVCCLLDKPSRREVEVRASWTGFEIPDEFVVGYGIDFAQRNRNLPYIGKVRFPRG